MFLMNTICLCLLVSFVRTAIAMRGAPWIAIITPALHTALPSVTFITLHAVVARFPRLRAALLCGQEQRALTLARHLRARAQRCARAACWCDAGEAAPRGDRCGCGCGCGCTPGIALYWTLMVGCIALYVVQVFPRWVRHRAGSPLILGALIALVVLTFASYIAVVRSDPGIFARAEDDGAAAPRMPATLRSGAPRSRWPHDGVLYLAGADVVCRTCRIVKPPRTKHCAVCDNCVGTHDHHCPWTGKCVGENNFALFVGFVATHLITMLAATAVGARLLVTIAAKYKLWDVASYAIGDRAPRPAPPPLDHAPQWSDVMRVITGNAAPLVVSIAIATFTATTLAGFLATIIWSAATATLTSESIKLTRREEKLRRAEADGSEGAAAAAAAALAAIAAARTAHDAGSAVANLRAALCGRVSESQARSQTKKHN